MVEGLDRFKAYFANYADQYVLIGGTACAVVMENVGETFRATKDLDIVLCIDDLNSEFGTAFWQFIRDGKYETQQKAEGKSQFYRFRKPNAENYPYMLELFSRAPVKLSLAEESHLTPIPMDDEVSSLSAILLDDDYYSFLMSGKHLLDGLSVVGAEHLIPLKAKAYLDLKERKSLGDKVDSTDIKKHKNDVFRLSVIVDPDFNGNIPEKVKTDIATFLTQMESEKIDLKAFGISNRNAQDVIEELRSIYGI